MKTTKKQQLENCTDYKSATVIDNNTLRIEYNNGNSAIRLHNTDIITFAGKKIILNSGGWRTVTTKDRINKYSPARLYQNKGLWYLSEGKLFYDNCVIDQSGKLISKELKNTVIESKVTKLKKQITKYCNLITKDNLPEPNSGDCWLCLFMDKDGKQNDHLLEHIKQGYLHGSILVNAMIESGYRNDGQIGLFYHMKLVDAFKRSVRKYLQKRLISNIAVK
jgi:hypothetical protein